MTQRFFTPAELGALIDEQIAAKTRVVAPVCTQEGSDHLEYRPIHKFTDATLGVALPHASIKEFFLPRTDILLQYKQTKDGVEIKEVSTQAQPQIILGAVPCDVAGLEIVDKVMNWDYRDELWFGRREATTIISVTCNVMDAACFCTAVGLGPESTRGADIMLTAVEGGYLATVLTAKGEALLENHPGQEADAALIAKAETAQAEARRKVEENLPAIPSDMAEWLAKNYDLPYWKTLSLRCHGCGVCASVCPTCHCFDIVDEHSSDTEGTRRRNWDTCQSGQFTVHTSGHNPRATQTERLRQRIMHKFSIYPTRFKEILCTGCGRCARACPGGIVLPEIISELTALCQAGREEKD